LVKSIVTLPAFALSEVLSNFSCPLGSAATASEDPPAGAAAVLDVAALVDVEVLVAAGADAVLLLLELEPPHAARPRAAAATHNTTAGNLSIRDISSRPEFTARMLAPRGVGR
jgi:hypothetical protein